MRFACVESRHPSCISSFSPIMHGHKAFLSALGRFRVDKCSDSHIQLSGSGSEDRESTVSFNTRKELDPEPLSTTPSPYLSREFYLECIKITVERVSIQWFKSKKVTLPCHRSMSFCILKFTSAILLITNTVICRK